MATLASERPLTQKSLRTAPAAMLACMRMLCDTPYILYPEVAESAPKLPELRGHP